MRISDWSSDVCSSDLDAGRAEEMARKYIGSYWHSVVKHYDFIGDHFSKLKGYESYREAQAAASAPGGLDAMTEFFLGIQIWGTPAMCYAKTMDVMRRTGGGAPNATFSYGCRTDECRLGNECVCTCRSGWSAS